MQIELEGVNDIDWGQACMVSESSARRVIVIRTKYGERLELFMYGSLDAMLDERDEEEEEEEEEQYEA